MSLNRIETSLRKSVAHDETTAHKTPIMSAVLSVPIGTALGFAVQSRREVKGTLPLAHDKLARVCISAPFGGK